MFNTLRPQFNSVTRPLSRRQTQRGQSIVVALLVLLLLGLAGALFVTIVARNLINANKSNRVQTADQYASAGITYADSQLSSSIDGADWRPPLQFQLAVPPTEARELARYTAAVAANRLPSVNADDPDAEYLQAGYARYNTGAGRYLVRVTYDPVNVSGLAVPPGKYLKIESIGREGNIDSLDPTTYNNNRSNDKTQAFLVAYKPIGITDYARFETNPDKRSDIANLGVVSQFYANTDGSIVTPGVFDFSKTGTTGSSGSGGSTPTLSEYPVITTYGAADAYIGNPPTQPNPNAGTLTAIPTAMGPTGFTPGGGSIHSNMSVRFFGTNVIYLNLGADSPQFQDTAEIGGNLLLDTYDPKASLNNVTVDNSGSTPLGQQASLILNPVDLTKLTATPIPYQPATATTPATPAKNTYITPSNDNQSTGDVNLPFSTQHGLIRDASMQNDPEGLPRSITRLEPPLVDAQDNASQMPRYRAIAMNSAPRPNLMLNGSAYTPTAGINPSLYGYGKAIYVNNPNDVQKDSAAIGGGSTLTDEWLHRTAANSAGTNKGDWNGLFYNPPGVTIVLGQLIPATPSNGAVTAVPAGYGIRLTQSNGENFVGPDGTTNSGPEMNVRYSDLDTDPTGAASDNDIVIYAEGNVRVRGILSPIEPARGGSTTQIVPRHITIVTGGTAYIEGNLLKGSPDSTISVLAHDYVCINTTQFLAGAVQGELPQLPAPPANPSVPLAEITGGNPFTQQFGFGFTNPGATTPQTPTTQYGGKLALYVSGNTPNGFAQADFNILDSAGNTVFNTATSNAVFNTSTGFPMPTFGTLTHLTFDLSNTTLASLTGATGDSTFQLTVQKDPGNIAADTTHTPNLPGSNPGAQQDPLLERVAVLPMDIRIEAVLYAQTGSFFVIPGEWFNRDSSDNLSTYLADLTRPNLTADLNASGFMSGSTLYGNLYTSLSRFPMYGQPVDLKITIDGSVSEAHPADIAAQTAWMQHWGWIPQYHGSLVTTDTTVTPNLTPETAGHILSGQPAIGLQIIYDPQAGYPYDPAPTTGTAYYLRSDVFGRPLPFTPKLPVSTGLLYSGQSGEAPLLQ